MSNDFDFLLGGWRVMNTRLARWLNDCTEWVEFESFHQEKKLSTGLGNIAHHQYVLGQAFHERTVLRSYNNQYDFWKIDRLDDMTTLLMSPLKGTFWSNKGSFLSTGKLDTKDVLVWVEWTKICKTFACWEQALSPDNGKTWETNWVMEFWKVK
jgi:hypothetical protein